MGLSPRLVLLTKSGNYARKWVFWHVQNARPYLCYLGTNANAPPRLSLNPIMLFIELGVSYVE
jgi:hypothetical protein